MDEYVKIMKEDYSLLGNVILQSRGNMALDKFAMKCGYSPRVFQGYIRNEKTKKYNDWRGVKRLADALADNGDPASGITRDAVYASLGMIKGLCHSCSPAFPEANLFKCRRENKR